MYKLARVLRDRESKKRTMTFLVFLFSSLGILIQIGSTLFGSRQLEFLGLNYIYFTTQSNLLLIIVSALYLFKKETPKWLPNLAFIALINIFVTGVVFHILLTPYMSSVSFLNHMLHTINPILYILFYYLILPDHIEPKKFYISLIYPLIFMAFVYLFVEPIFGDLLDQLMPDYVGARFVYPFLDPKTYDSGVRGLAFFNLGILAPIIALTSYLMAFLKSKFEIKINN